VVSRAEEGLLECEYTLFAASDVLLAAPIAGAGVREQGYLTTAGIASGRLEALGITNDLATVAFGVIAGELPELVRAKALSSNIIDKLGPCEAFQGAVYSPITRRYEGLWVDVDAIARATDLDIAFAMQLLHLAAALADTPRDTPVRLWTGGSESPAGARSFKRFPVDARELPRALAKLKRPIQTVLFPSEVDLCDALVRDLRARAAAGGDTRRLHALASAVTRARDGAAGEKQALPDIIITDELEYEPVPLIDELRSHHEMLHGEWHLREVAQFLTAMAARKVDAPDLAVLAARAWLASGEVSYARYFARRAMEDATAGVGTRLAASDILDSTTPTKLSMHPPPAMLEPPTRIVLPDELPRSGPPGASQPPTEIIIPPAPRVAHFETPRLKAPPVPRIEVVETMSHPEGNNTRIRMSRLARELARDYRLSYGVTLKTDEDAIDAMQRHLRRRFSDAKQDARVSQMLNDELTRHGALLSEILARTLGAQWTDVSSPELGRWAMAVPPSTRVWPIGRVYRFFEQDQNESDLVMFYVELEKAART